MSELSVESIAFWRPRSRAVAMTTEDRMSPVPVPEWVRGSVNHPIALAPLAFETLLGLTVDVTFSVDVPPAGPVEIRAVPRADMMAATFGSSAAVVTFDSEGTTAAARFEFEITPRSVEIGCLTLRWDVKRDGEWRDFAFTQHEVAILLGRPTTPWLPGHLAIAEADEHVRPWWEVIRRACVVASGSRTPDEVVSRITLAVYHRGLGGAYFWGTGAQYASDPGIEPAFFDCGQFLDLLRGDRVPQCLDCVDLSTIVVTLANAVGSSMRTFMIATGGQTRMIRLVGYSQPLPGKFHTHQLAINRDGEPSVWDACLALRGSNGVERVPVGDGQQEYLDDLIFSSRGTLEKHEHPDRIEFRPIRRPPNLENVPRRDDLTMFADLYGFHRWSRGASLFPDGTDGVTRELVELPSTDLLIAERLYFTPDEPAARLRLLSVLARFHPLEMREVSASDELAVFESRDDFAVVAAAIGRRCIVLSGVTTRTSKADVAARLRELWPVVSR